ncbi:MAG: hypothetical protein P4L45_14440 [Ignavibacteriaceae bacterium]|nr:hypothetical protein [Ignavibacteriaceae bacterium]
MTLIIISTTLLTTAVIYIYKLIKTAPLRYEGDGKFFEAIIYEDRLSHIFENDLGILS